jgi:hypothetical protein
MDIEKLKELALAAPKKEWYSEHQIADGITWEGSIAFIAACSAAAVLELIAEVERLRADATRYRWLRNPKRSHAHVGRIVDNSGKAAYLAEFSLDRAVDAAIEKEKA